MRNFLSINDVDSLSALLLSAQEIKSDRFAFNMLGKNRTLLLIFFNSSLRTRLSTQKAATNLGMNVIVLDINQGAWKLETEYGVVMDSDKPEHILEAIPVMASYCDIIGVRSFASLTDREGDYQEKILTQFVRYSGKPVISLESATRHPLQSFADVITIEQYKKRDRPKVVLTWAPHPNPLPQAVANSFAEWVRLADYELVVTHPKGYELSHDFVPESHIEYDVEKAYENADFIYAKNWSVFDQTNYGKILSKDMRWMVDSNKMQLTNSAKFMHCLPVRRNMIVEDSVIDGPQSIVLEQASNREISAQVILKEILTSQF